MKVVVSKTDLASLIGNIQSIVVLKSPIPILSNILLEAIDGQLIVSATDRTVSMQCYMEATIVEEGAIALPGKKFYQLVRELTAPQVKISSSAQEVAEITAGTSIFRIHGMSKTEFPAFPDLSSFPKIRISASLLKEMLSKTAFSASREETRYLLNGIQLTLQQQRLTLIGTDGKRLARTSSSISADPSMQGQFVLPIKAAEEMMKLLSDSNEEVELTLTPDKIALESGSQTLIAKLLSGQYPDVEKVIPSKPIHEFSIHREELMALLRQVSLFVGDSGSSIRFQFETGQLSLFATSSEIGEGRVSMAVDFAGPRFEIAFNPLYFLDFLRHSKDETIRFGLTDPHNPGLITDSSSAKFVIMPMRLNDVSVRQEMEPAALS
jgi:DNA polymerase-3 subunit beta